MTLRRNVKVDMIPMFYDGEFIGYDVFQGDDLKLACEQNYFIYMSYVNLREDGSIDGRYLGFASDNLIDEHCKNVIYNDGVGYQVEGRKIKTAKMVAVKNDGEKQVIIVIE